MIATGLAGALQFAMISVSSLVRVGAAGALGRPMAWAETGDQSPVPTELRARTRTR